MAESASTRGVFLTATWRHLVMLNYEIDPDVLAPFVPAACSLDTFDGRVLTSVVGFQFLNTRVARLPIPGHRDFEEVNLRFYVRHTSDGDVRRGVVFVREIVPRHAIAWVARRIYGENYVALPLSHRDDLGDDDGSIEYRWILNGRPQALRAVVSGTASIPKAGSEAAFITEHYWGYTRRSDGSTFEYRVEHPTWLVHTNVDAELRCDVAPLYGAPFAPFLETNPCSALVAVGSPVVVRRGRRVV